MTDFDTLNDADRFRFLVKFNEDKEMNEKMDDIMDEWFRDIGGSAFVDESPEHWLKFIDKAREVAVELGLWPALETADLRPLVDRFLAWPLPASVCSDPCASSPAYPHRSGTNLLTAEEAEAMLKHVLGGE